MWAADDNIYRIDLVLFRLTEGRLECLSFLCVVTVSHTHLSLSQLKVWHYNKLHIKCLYADTKRKENAIHYFYILVVLNFLIINTVYNYFLI